MDAVQFIRRQFVVVRRVSDGVTANLTDDLLNWTPPGTANPVAATLIHCLSAEDGFVQERIQGKPSVWSTGGWSDKIGLRVLPDKGSGWEEVRSGKYSTDAIRAYQEAVRGATNAYLETLAPGELDREINFARNQWTVADTLALLVEHTAHHMGEIAALKGVQGAKGLPF